MVSLAPALILLSGCLLEVTTGVPRPLDPEYITPGTSGRPDGAAEPPWVDLDGPSVTLDGLISAASEGPVDLDFWVENTETLGGWDRIGRIGLDAPGPWAIEAPVGFGTVALEAFQDAYGDGPTGDDPFGVAEVTIGAEPVSAPEIALDEGSRFEALSRRFADQAPFADYTGETVRISGTVRSDVDQIITLDLRQPDAYGELSFVGVLPLAELGPWHLEVPADYGELVLRAFQDQRGDGPSADDTFASVTLLIGEDDQEHVDLELSAGALAVAGGDQPKPFKDYEGEVVRLAGTVRSELDRAVQIDVRTVDPTAEGGFSEDGKLELGAPRAWTFKAPVDHGELLIQAFQDLSDDGPSDDDPFGFAVVDVGEEPILDIELELKIGGKLELARAMGHGEGEASIKACRDWDGPTISISGSVSGGEDRPVSLDFRVPDESAEGGVTQICREELAEPGAWRAEVGAEWTELMIEAFQDMDANGPSEADPFGEAIVPLAGANIDGVDIAMVVGARKGDHGGDGTPGDGRGGTPGDGQGGAAAAFSDYDGPWVTLRGEVDSSFDERVTFDFAVPDASAPGGRRRLGVLSVEQAGPYELEVPSELGAASLEIFQDLSRDGPSDDDPYATANIEVGTGDVTLSVRLIQGARGQPTGGGDPHAGGGGGAQSECFSDMGRNPVSVEGTIALASGVEDGQVKLDLFVPDPTGQGGRRQICSLHVSSGAYRFEAPDDFGTLFVEAFIDRDNDGPSPGDPFGQYEGGKAVEIEGDDISGIDITLEPTGGSEEGI